MLLNLHSHLEGRIRPATAHDLAVAAGLPDADRDWDDALVLDRPGTLTEYLAKVAASYPFFAVPEHLARLTREAVEDAAADGQDYLELRFGPATHSALCREGGIPVAQIVEAACAGLAEGIRATGMPAGIVVAALRHHDAEVNAQVAATAAAWAGSGIVGFDLAGDELLFPELHPHRAAFRIAAAAGLGLTCHAAEAAPGHRAREAAQTLGVTRIGHGVRVAHDAETMAWLAGEGIVIETCPTSNRYTGAIGLDEPHPAPTFAAAGVRLVLGDDNPVQTGSPLAAERDALRALGFDKPALRRIDETSIAAAFLDPATRAALQAKLRGIR